MKTLPECLRQHGVYEGEISPSAFNLRPHIRETYISVLRECMETFALDIKKICKELPVDYALMPINSVKSLKIVSIEDDIKFSVKAVDNATIKSHAGIFITINEQQLVGGEPFESLEIKRGKSADCVLLEIRKAIAKLASRNIKSFEG